MDVENGAEPAVSGAKGVAVRHRLVATWETSYGELGLEVPQGPRAWSV